MSELLQISQLRPASEPDSSVDAMQRAVRQLQQERELVKPRADAHLEKEGYITKPLEAIIQNGLDLMHRPFDRFGNPDKHWMSFGPAALKRGVNRVDELDKAAEDYKLGGMLQNKEQQQRATNQFRLHYKEITGKDWNQQEISKNLLAENALKAYTETSNKFFDFSTMIATGWVAGLITRPAASSVAENLCKSYAAGSLVSKTIGYGVPFVMAALAGAGAKPLFSELDQREYNMRRELASGALWGGLWPAYALVGKASSNAIVRAAEHPENFKWYLPNHQMANLLKSERPVELLKTDLFTTAIKTEGSAVKGLDSWARFKLHQVADHASWTPGWIAFDVIGYPLQMGIDNYYEHGKHHTAADMLKATLMAFPIGIAGGAIGAPLFRYGAEPAMRMTVEQLARFKNALK